MKTGIIGLPQVGKTSLFRILTKANSLRRPHTPILARRISGSQRSQMNVSDKPADLYNPKNLLTPPWNTSTSAPSGRKR